MVLALVGRAVRLVKVVKAVKVCSHVVAHFEAHTFATRAAFDWFGHVLVESPRPDQ